MTARIIKFKVKPKWIGGEISPDLLRMESVSAIDTVKANPHPEAMLNSVMKQMLIKPADDNKAIEEVKDMIWPKPSAKLIKFNPDH